MSEIEPEACVVCGELTGWDDLPMPPACADHPYREVCDAMEFQRDGDSRDKHMASDIQQGGSHYCDRDIQPIDYALANDFNYWESAALKYLTRHRDKNGAEDLRKLIHCIQLGLEREYGE